MSILAKKYDDSPILPPQGASSTPHRVPQHVPKYKPDSPKPPISQMPSSPLEKPSEGKLIPLEELCKPFGVPHTSNIQHPSGKYAEHDYPED
uniref:Uncharacterized protein n=1 Tax=Meloidogyne floridensis TaxID=298350 RepID=A0A915P7T5_9BILA